MKKYYIVLFATLCTLFLFCTSSPTDKAQSSVKQYLKGKLKNVSSYEPLTFSELDTLEVADTSSGKQLSLYRINHIYLIENSENEKVKMSVSFYLDRDFNVTKPTTKSINGEYGTLTGNAYWKYNNFVGNKADAGAEVILLSLDTIRENFKFDVITDLQGNYKIEKVIPGNYFLIVRSKNVTDCPERHLTNLVIYSPQIKQLFGFDITKYQTEMIEINRIDSLYRASIHAFPVGGSFRQMDAQLAKSAKLEKEMREKAERLIDSFPDEFKNKIKLFTGYSNAFDFSIIRIEEGETENQISDFGITCI